MGVRAGGAADATQGEVEAAALAHALAQIAAEDPQGAEELGGVLGLHNSSVGATVAPNAVANPGPRNVGGNRFVDTLCADLTEDFDVDVTLSVAVLGTPCVGKTALVRRFARGAFSEEYGRTLVTEFIEKRMRITTASTRPGEEETEVTFHIWDTPGGSEPRLLARQECKRAKACMVVFSTDDRGSFEAVDLWVASIREACGPDVLLTLVLTKRDLANGPDAAVSEAEAVALAQRHRAHICLSSAREGDGAREAFEHLGRELLEREALAEERFRHGEARGGLQWGPPPVGTAPDSGQAWASSGAEPASASATVRHSNMLLGTRAEGKEEEIEMSGDDDSVDLPLP